MKQPINMTLLESLVRRKKPPRFLALLSATTAIVLCMLHMILVTSINLENLKRTDMNVIRQKSTGYGPINDFKPRLQTIVDAVENEQIVTINNHRKISTTRDNSIAIDKRAIFSVTNTSPTTKRGMTLLKRRVGSLNSVHRNRTRKQHSRKGVKKPQFVRNPTSESNGKYVDPFKFFTFENAPFDQYELNVPLSQSLPLHRSIAEVRPKQCLNRTYVISEPHKVSVIVPFHNEMWAVLLRTIHGLIDHSPSRMLHEIIMVDDFSTFHNLLEPLTAYVKTLGKVTLLRLKKRNGLIRARMAGARLATGNLLAFIDAHVESNPGWLEPLVDLVARERTTVAVPVVNSVDPLSFSYVHVPVISSGVFTWDLDYAWKDIYENYEQVGVRPHPTATMIGCSFLVDREFFFRVGAFDEGMDIWGGEQIEMSFRTWMCGGSVKVVPCSHVGHIYRAHLPYAFDKYILYKNLQRIAEVWMDDYKRYFYYTIQADPHKFTKEEVTTVQARKDLRRKLQCKPFSWYLKYITPEITFPNIGAVLFGNLRNLGSQLCLFEQTSARFHFREVGFTFCSRQTKALIFTLMDGGHLLHDGRCLGYRDTTDSAVTLALCDQTDARQLWQFRPGIPPNYQDKVIGPDVKRTFGSFRLKYGGYRLCLSQMQHEMVDIAGALDCGAENIHQFWIVTYSLNYDRNFLDVYSNVG